MAYGSVQLRPNGQSYNVEHLEALRNQDTRALLDANLPADKREEFVEIIASGLRAEARMSEITDALVKATDERTAPEAMGFLEAEAKAKVGRESAAARRKR